MNLRRTVMAGVLAGTLALGALPAALAATAQYNDSSATGGDAAWKAWVEGWEALSGDYTQVSLTPGRDETELNFAWYSKVEPGKAATPVVHFGADKNALTAFTGVSAEVDDSLTGGVKYVYNHVTVTGLKENTTYYYTVEKNGVQTQAETYATHSFSSVKMLYVGDPQIGASKGQPQNGEKLVADAGAANTAARNDGFAWARTLSIAQEQNPDLSFVISAGDQVNKTGKAKEEEYAGYLAPAVLKSLPVATTIGNHDSLNPDYLYHFNNPNATNYGATQAGGDYYYTYGAGLFIVLNTNNYNVAEHEAAIKEAVAYAPDAAWRVVTIHQDIYGSGLDHSDTDGMILRTQLTPIFDAYRRGAPGPRPHLLPLQAPLRRRPEPWYLRVPAQRRQNGLRLGQRLQHPEQRQDPPGPRRRGGQGRPERLPGRQLLLHHREHQRQYRGKPQGHAVHVRQLGLRLQVL